jgi:hypothetical protein
VADNASAAATFVQPQHLEWAALETARASFKADPAHYVALHDFLLPPVAERLSRFLADEAEFAPTFGTFDRFGMCSEEEFRAAPEARRFFSYGRLTGVRAEARSSECFGTWTALDKCFAAPSLRALFQTISGMPLTTWASSVRRMRRGDFLVPHGDDIQERVLSIVIYLSPDWRTEDGGALFLDQGDGGFARVEAAYNSVVIFDARTQHHVAPISVDHARLTVGGWYQARPR